MSRRSTAKSTRLANMLNDNSSTQNDTKNRQGLWRWYFIDDLALPCIFRSSIAYTPVRILEDKLLNKMHFRSGTAIDAAFRNRQMLVSTYLNVEEAQLLTNIPGSEYGAFTSQDLVVDLKDFQELLSFLKPLQSESPSPAAAPAPPPVPKPVTSPVPVPKAAPAHEPPTRSPTICGGWVQVNNSVIPYLSVYPTKFLPLSVVMNAAGLLRDMPSRGLPLTFPSDEQYLYLNELCQSVGLNFVFDSSSALVSIHSLAEFTVPAPYMQELPLDNPFAHACFVDDVPTSAADSSPAHKAPVDTSGSALDRSVVLRAASRLASCIQPTKEIGNELPSSGAGTLQHARSQASSYLPPQIAPCEVMESLASLCGSNPSASNPSAHRPAAVPKSVPQPAFVIESVQFRDRTISSVRRPAESASYVLLDAIVCVFFPQQRYADGFLRAFDTLYRIPEERMTPDEEQEFLRVYQLPTTRLRSNRLIRLDVLEVMFPRLEAIFALQQKNVGKGELIGSVFSLPAVTKADTSTGVPPGRAPVATTASSGSDQTSKPARKRRRKDDNQEIIVLD